MIKPILFNTQMVAAIVDGRKTVTRRIAKELWDEEIIKVVPPDGTPGKHGTNCYRGILPDRGDGNTYCVEAFPPYNEGDILYVRETFCRGRIEMTDEPDGYPGQLYISQCLGEDDIIFKEAAIRYDIGMDDVTWRPSIHMPKWAARIFLRVKSVKLYHLNDMNEEDAMVEGIEDEPAGEDSPLERFSVLWDSTISRADMRRFGWYANPFVWAIEFERTDEPDGWRDLAPTDGDPSDVIETPDWATDSDEEVMTDAAIES